jgi:hypothetical protein
MTMRNSIVALAFTGDRLAGGADVAADMDHAGDVDRSKARKTALRIVHLLDQTHPGIQSAVAQVSLGSRSALFECAVTLSNIRSTNGRTHEWKASAFIATRAGVVRKYPGRAAHHAMPERVRDHIPASAYRLMPRNNSTPARASDA